jgi:hypothetical protein
MSFILDQICKGFIAKKGNKPISGSPLLTLVVEYSFNE